MKQSGTWRDILENHWPVYSEIAASHEATARMLLAERDHTAAGRAVYDWLSYPMSEDEIVRLSEKVAEWNRDWYAGEDDFWHWLSTQCGFLPAITDPSGDGLYCRKPIRDGFEGALFAHVGTILKRTEQMPLQ